MLDCNGRDMVSEFDLTRKGADFPEWSGCLIARESEESSLYEASK